MPQCSFSARNDEGLLALLSVLLLSPKAPFQEEIYIPRFPCLSRAFCKALLLQALHTQELDWHRGSVSIPSGSASISLTFYTKSVIWRHRWQLSCEFPPSVAGNCLVLLPWLLCELDRRADLALNCITCSCYMALKEVILQAWLQLWCVLQHGHTKMCTFAVLDWEAERVKKKKEGGRLFKTHFNWYFCQILCVIKPRLCLPLSSFPAHPLLGGPISQGRGGFYEQSLGVEFVYSIAAVPLCGSLPLGII